MGAGVSAQHPKGMDMPRGVYERKTNPTVEEAATEELAGKDPLHRTAPFDTLDAVAKEPGVTYMALKPMKVNGQQVQPGEIVEDAANWRNLHNYVSAGYLTAVRSSS